MEVRRGFVLVLDLAEDLLQEILQGYQAGEAAELVHHHGQLGAGPLEVPQQLRMGLLSGTKWAGFSRVARGRVGAGGSCMRSLSSRMPTMLSMVVLVDRHAGVAAVPEGLPRPPPGWR